MVNPLLPLMITALTCSPPHVNLNASAKDPLACLKKSPQLIIIAGSHAGEDPHGEDPHGGDPNDENHDPGLPANQDKSAWKAPSDPYGGSIPNQKQPTTPF